MHVRREFSSGRYDHCFVSLRALFVVVALLISFGSQRAQAQCITIRLTPGIGMDSLDFGRVLLGSHLDSTFNVINADTTPTGLILRDGIGVPSLKFTILSPSFPDSLVTRDSVGVTVRFKADSIGTFLRVDTLKTICGNTVIQSIGTTVAPTSDSETIDILDNSHPFIGIIDSSATAYRLFYFKNDSGNSVQIDSLKSADTSHFVVVSNSTLPKTLARGDSLEVLVTFKANDTLLHVSECIVVTQPPLPGVISLEGARMPLTDAVSKPNAQPEFAFVVMPNPSSGDVTVLTTGLASGKVEIFDILGAEVLSAKVSEHWTWDGRSRSGRVTPSGVYILRVKGIDRMGHSVRGSKRLLIEH